MNKKLFTTAVLIMVLGMLITGCASENTVASVPDATEVPPTPTIKITETAQPTAAPTEGFTTAIVDARRTEILDYITNLSNEPFAGVISGQNCYHGTEILSSSWVRGYANMIEKLHTETGQWIGIIGVDYEYLKIFTPEELAQANKALIDYAKAGGLVTITLTPQNPWVNDESDLVSNPGTWDGPAGTQNQAAFAQVTSLNDLIDPAQPVNVAWMRKLDRVAAALQELRDAGVVVFFRPMQEMNGNWFWWGMRSHPYDPTPYGNVYRHMRDYFTNEKQLNNLIWVYSPNASFGEGNNSTWNRTVDWAYPGDAYVDIVAGTNYADNLVIGDYAKYITMKKPLGIAELGPTIGGPAAKNGSWDTSQIVARIKTSYPRISYWVSWHSYPGESWSLIANKNYDVLMNDPDVINRDDFHWSWLE
jgi:mannan endo-1,4-beta-mannosidase